MGKAKKIVLSKEEAYSKVFNEVYASCLKSGCDLSYVEVLGIIELVKISVTEEMRAKAISTAQQNPVSYSSAKSDERPGYIG